MRERPLEVHVKPTTNNVVLYTHALSSQLLAICEWRGAQPCALRALYWLEHDYDCGQAYGRDDAERSRNLDLVVGWLRAHGSVVSVYPELWLFRIEDGSQLSAPPPRDDMTSPAPCAVRLHGRVSRRSRRRRAGRSRKGG